MEELLDKNDLAKILKKSPITIRNLCNRDPKKLPPFLKVGNHARWLPSDVTDWIEEQKQQTCPACEAPEEKSKKKKPGRPTKTQSVQQRRVAQEMA